MRREVINDAPSPPPPSSRRAVTAVATASTASPAGAAGGKGYRLARRLVRRLARAVSRRKGSAGSGERRHGDLRRQNVVFIACLECLCGSAITADDGCGGTMGGGAGAAKRTAEAGRTRARRTAEAGRAGRVEQTQSAAPPGSSVDVCRAHHTPLDVPE